MQSNQRSFPIKVRWLVTGTVKKFMDNKGFGFITPDEGNDEVFFHQSEIVMEGFRPMDEGQRVEFTV